MQYTFLKLLGETYNCGAYGADGYNANCTQAAATGTGGGLSYTGEPWFWALATAVVIVAISVVFLLKNRRKKV